MISETPLWEYLEVPGESGSKPPCLQWRTVVLYKTIGVRHGWPSQWWSEKGKEEEKDRAHHPKKFRKLPRHREDQVLAGDGPCMALQASCVALCCAIFFWAGGFWIICSNHFFLGPDQIPLPRLDCSAAQGAKVITPIRPVMCLNQNLDLSDTAIRLM